MSTITITCPDCILRSLHASGEGFAAELRLLAAVKLYELVVSSPWSVVL